MANVRLSTARKQLAIVLFRVTGVENKGLKKDLLRLLIKHVFGDVDDDEVERIVHLNTKALDSPDKTIARSSGSIYVSHFFRLESSRRSRTTWLPQDAKTVEQKEMEYIKSHPEMIELSGVMSKVV